MINLYLLCLVLTDPQSSVNSDQPPKTWHGHKDAITYLACSKNAQLLVSGGKDGVACVWDVKTGKRMLQLAGHKDMVSSLGRGVGGRDFRATVCLQTVTDWRK